MGDAEIVFQWKEDSNVRNIFKSVINSSGHRRHSLPGAVVDAHLRDEHGEHVIERAALRAHGSVDGADEVSEERRDTLVGLVVNGGRADDHPLRQKAGIEHLGAHAVVLGQNLEPADLVER